MSSLLATFRLGSVLRPVSLLRLQTLDSRVPIRIFIRDHARLFRSAIQYNEQAELSRAPSQHLPFNDFIVIQNISQHKIPPLASKTASQNKGQITENFRDVYQTSAVEQAIQKPVQSSKSTSDCVRELPSVPAYHRGSKFDRVPYWQQIGRWKDVTENQFLSYRWSVSRAMFCT